MKLSITIDQAIEKANATIVEMKKDNQAVRRIYKRMLHTDDDAKRSAMHQQAFKRAVSCNRKENDIRVMAQFADGWLGYQNADAHSIATTTALVIRETAACAKPWH